MGNTLSGLTPSQTFQGLIKVGNNTNVDGTAKVLSDGSGTDLPIEVSTAGVNLTGSPTVNSVAIANTNEVAAKQDTLVSGTNIKTINGTSVLGSGDIVTPSTPPSGVAGAIQFTDGTNFASDAANLFWDDTNNRLGIGTNAPTATTHIIGVDQLNTSTSLLVTDSIGTQILRVHNQANNSAVVMTTAKIASYEIISGNVLANASMRFVPTSTGLAINKDYSSPAASTLVHIKGSGSTSATTSLLVQNSAGTNLLSVNDIGEVFIDRQIIARNTGFGGWIQANSFNGNLALVGYVNGNNDHIWQTASNFNNCNLRQNASGVGISIGSVPTIDSSAIFNLTSTTKGFLPPRMTTTQKNAIASPASGLQVYDTTLNQMCYYNGSSWINF